MEPETTELEKECGPPLPDVKPVPPAPAEGKTLFPVGTKVIDISKDVGVPLQNVTENVKLGGGYCVMWMLYLALRVVKMNKLWGEGVSYETRKQAYKTMYDQTYASFTRHTNVSDMADLVREKVNTFNGKTRSMKARVIKASDGKITSTQGDPYTKSSVMEPTVTAVKKIIRGEGKDDQDGDVEVGGGAGGGGGGRFYAPSDSVYGYDIHVKSLIDQPQMVRPKLRELIEKGDKPVIFNVLMRQQKAGASNHALLAIYFPAAFTGGVPEVHVLTTYPILPQEIENIRTIRVAAKAGRRRRTFKKNRRQRAIQTRKYNRCFQ